MPFDHLPCEPMAECSLTILDTSIVIFLSLPLNSAFLLNVPVTLDLVIRNTRRSTEKRFLLDIDHSITECMEAATAGLVQIKTHCIVSHNPSSDCLLRVPTQLRVSQGNNEGCA
jgi:hypothetical protein